MTYIIINTSIHNLIGVDMSRKALILAFLFISSSTHSQNCVEWSQVYEIEGSITIGHDVKQLVDGDFILVGESRNTQNDLYIVKTDSLGIVQWSLIFDSLGPGQSVQVLDDGSFVFAGGQSLIKTSSNGETIWLNNYDFNIGEMKKSRDGGYVLAGNYRVENVYRLVLVLTDSTGNEIWRNDFTGDGHGGSTECNKLLMTTDMGFILAGRINHYFMVIKTDSTGEEQWRYQIESHEAISCNAICQCDDGGFIMNATVQHTRGPMLIVKIDSAGEEDWINEWWETGGIVTTIITEIDDYYLLFGAAGYYDPYRIFIRKYGDGGGGWTRFLDDYQYSSAFQTIPTVDEGYAIIGGYHSNSRMLLVKIAPNFATDIDENYKDPGIPVNFKVLSQYPNPFNSISTIDLIIPRSGIIKINVSNILGQMVESVEYRVDAGIKRYQLNCDYWNNGIYFSTFQFYDESVTRRLVLIK